MGRLSGPIFERIDIHIEEPAVPFQVVSAPPDGTSCAATREHMNRTRAVQRKQRGLGGGYNPRRCRY
jgi:magnesium chelatase family protein